MAVLPNIGGALCESSVILFLVPRRKVWLKPTARVPCSNADNIRERKTWTQSEFCTWQKLRYGARAPEMHIVTVQDTGEHPAKLAWPPLCDVGAVTKPGRETRWNLLGCPKLTKGSQPLADRNSPYCEDMWRRYCCLRIFSDCQYMPYLQRYSSTKLCDGAQIANFCILHFLQRAACSIFQTCILNSH